MEMGLSDFMPELLTKARAIHDSFAAIAMILVFAGVIAASVKGAYGDIGRTLRAVTLAGIIAVVIAAFPSWVDQLQLLAHSLVTQMDVDPSTSHEKFARLVAGPPEANGSDVGFWDVMWSDQGGIGKAVLYAIILLMGKIALAIMWLGYLVQQLVLIFSISLSPIFLSMLMLGPTREIGVRFILSLFAVLLWPLGWAVASILTDGLLQMAASNQVYQQSGDNLVMAASQGFFLIVVLSIWILVSTIAAPFAISKALQAGTQIGGSFLSSLGAAVSQGGSYALGAGVTASMSGAGTGVTSAAASLAGIGGVVTGAAGSTGMILPAAIGTMAVMAGSSKTSSDFSKEASEIVKKGAKETK